LFHFLMSLTQENNYAQGSRFDPQIVVSFFNELSRERKTMLKTSISFFNELSAEKRNYARDLCFIFLTSLPQRREAMLVMTLS
jgi:hypothetical protein